MPNKIALNDLYTDVNFRYSFNSCIGENEGYRYIVEINEDIVASNEIDGEFLIGKATRHLFLLGNAINDGYNIKEIFDVDMDLFPPMNEIYDYANYNIKADLENALYGDDGMWNQNICLFTRLGILPKYRGHGIAEKVIKDNYNILGSMCGLIVMHPFPLQLEYHKLHVSEFEKGMCYDNMEHDEDKAMKSLRNFYKKIGYRTVKGYDDLMFLTPNIPNKKLDAIDIKESVFNLRK